MSENKDLVRLHIWVIGRVQAVGFRAYVESHARRLNLTGWVRNVGYDTVEALAEGPRAAIEEFIAVVKQGPLGAHVDESRLDWETPTGEFHAFGVRRSQ